MEEQRQQRRQRVFKGGKVFFNGGRSTVDCLIRDMTTAGARLKLESTGDVPDAFDLLVDQEQQVYPAEVAWRDMTSMGVRFTGAPRPLQARLPSSPLSPRSPLRQ